MNLFIDSAHCNKPMMNTNPLHLPEIQTHLGQFLSTNSLLSCILVCREWHDAFYPSLWLDTRLNLPVWHQKLTPDLILKNSHHIRMITLNRMEHPQLEDMHLSQLRRVVLLVLGAQQLDLAVWSEKFFLEHRTTLVSVNVLLNIEAIRYSSDSDQAMNRTTTMAPGWHVFKELYQLQYLFLMCGRVQPHSWDDCWQTWCRLNFLSLKVVSFEETVRSNSLPVGAGFVPNPWVPKFVKIRSAGLHLLNNVRQLELWSLMNIESANQLQLVLCFPKLERLVWSVRRISGPLPLREFAIAIADEGCCPLLTNVELNDDGRIQDRDLAKLLKAMKVITGIQVTKAGFGPLSLRVLLKKRTLHEKPASSDGADGIAAEEMSPLPPRIDKKFRKSRKRCIEALGYDFDSNRAAGPGNDDAAKEIEPRLSRKSHADTLMFFKMAQCPGVTGAMLHQILCSCPNLKQFTGAVIRDTDMFTEKILPCDEFRPWKCVKLKKFQCFFEVQDKARNRQVLQAVGSLTHLDILQTSFGSEQRAAQVDSRHCWTLNLRTGLEELGSLRLLSEWRSDGQIDLGMDLKDVDWMVDNLPNLSFFRKNLLHQMDSELKRRLTSRGIRTS